MPKKRGYGGNLPSQRSASDTTKSTTDSHHVSSANASAQPSEPAGISASVSEPEPAAAGVSDAPEPDTYESLVVSREGVRAVVRVLRCRLSLALWLCPEKGRNGCMALCGAGILAPASILCKHQDTEY